MTRLDIHDRDQMWARLRDLKIPLIKAFAQPASERTQEVEEMRDMAVCCIAAELQWREAEVTEVEDAE